MNMIDDIRESAEWISNLIRKSIDDDPSFRSTAVYDLTNEHIIKYLEDNFEYKGFHMKIENNRLTIYEKKGN